MQVCVTLKIHFVNGKWRQDGDKHWTTTKHNYKFQILLSYPVSVHVGARWTYRLKETNIRYYWVKHAVLRGYGSQWHFKGYQRITAVTPPHLTAVKRIYWTPENKISNKLKCNVTAVWSWQRVFTSYGGGHQHQPRSKEPSMYLKELWVLCGSARKSEMSVAEGYWLVGYHALYRSSNFTFAGFWGLRMSVCDCVIYNPWTTRSNNRRQGYFCEIEIKSLKTIDFWFLVWFFLLTSNGGNSMNFDYSFRNRFKKV